MAQEWPLKYIPMSTSLSGAIKYFHNILVVEKLWIYPFEVHMSRVQNFMKYMYEKKRKVFFGVCGLHTLSIIFLQLVLMECQVNPTKYAHRFVVLLFHIIIDFVDWWICGLILRMYFTCLDDTHGWETQTLTYPKEHLSYCASASWRWWTFNETCHPGDQYWDHYPGTLSCNQVTTTHLKIGHLLMKLMGAQSSNVLQWLKIGYQDSSSSNDH